METVLLTAFNREEKGKVARKHGFIPGVIYGNGIMGETIKFKENEFIKILKQHGERAKIKFMFNDCEKFGIIKDVDRNSINNKVQHVDIQLVKEGEVVNWEIPINYLGKEKLKSKRLLLQTELDKIEVSGNVENIPNTIDLAVGDMGINQVITINDLKLDSSIKSIKSKNTVLGVVKPSVSNDASDDDDEQNMIL